MQSFIEQHRPLIVRHARAVVDAHAEKLAAEDVAREMELELGQLAAERALVDAQILSPDAYLRVVAKHAFGRAKRRRALLEQLAAGDDLDALSKDMAELDSDLPPLPSPPSPEGERARATLDGLKDALAPLDALVAAMLLEDDGSMDDVAGWLSMAMGDVAASRERILGKAAALGLEPRLLGQQADARREDRPEGA